MSRKDVMSRKMGSGDRQASSIDLKAQDRRKVFTGLMLVFAFDNRQLGQRERRGCSGYPTLQS
jgi:hypothetical protein